MKIQVFIVVFLVCILNSFSAFSEMPGRAIVIQSFKSDDVLVNMILEEIDKKIIANSEKNNLALYHISESESKLVLHPYFVGKEKPYQEIIFFKPNIWFNHEAEFVTIQDTSGNTINAYFKMDHGAKIDIKAIEIATSRIIKYSNAEVLKPSTERMDVKDFIKEFGCDPNKLKKSNPQKYDEVVKKITKEYKQKIFDYYKNRVESSILKSWFNPADYTSDEKLFEVIPPKDLNIKKINEFYFNGSSKDNLINGRIYLCGVKREIENYYYYEILARFKISEIGEKESKMTSLHWGSKELAESLIKGEKVILIPEDVEIAINTLDNNKKGLKISLALEKQCIFCAIENEKALLKNPVVTLVERASSELKYFTDLAKKEEYLDFSNQELHEKKIGLDLYLLKRDKFLEAIEVSTNKTIASVDMTYKFLGFSNVDLITPDVLSIILNSYKPKDFGIQYIKIIKEKKDRVETILAYNPLGFSRLSKYEIFTLAQEELNGEIIFRRNIIGICEPKDYYSMNLATLNIKKGSMEVSNALKQNQEIYFINSIKN